MVEIISPDRIFSQRWLQVQHAILHKRVRPIVGVPLELPVAATSHRDLVLPLLEIEEVKFVLPDELVGEGRRTHDRHKDA